jgi:phospholipid transport system substrate-binding protein
MAARLGGALLFSGFLWVAFASLAPAQGGDEAEALVEIMKERDQAIQDIVRSETEGETQAERAQLKKLIGQMFDFATFSEKSLGRYWRKRTEAEKSEFIDLCRRLVEKNYADPKLYTKAERIDYLGAEVDGSEAVLNTEVFYKSEQSSIDYVLHRRDGEWLIHDMVIDDLSIVKNNRSQFYKEIRKSSYEGLVGKLRDKLVDDEVNGSK